MLDLNKMNNNNNNEENQFNKNNQRNNFLLVMYLMYVLKKIARYHQKVLKKNFNDIVFLSSMLIKLTCGI